MPNPPDVFGFRGHRLKPSRPSEEETEGWAERRRMRTHGCQLRFQCSVALFVRGRLPVRRDGPSGGTAAQRSERSALLKGTQLMWGHSKGGSCGTWLQLPVFWGPRRTSMLVYCGPKKVLGSPESLQTRTGDQCGMLLPSVGERVCPGEVCPLHTFGIYFSLPSSNCWNLNPVQASSKKTACL